jgi:glutathione synthase/RimK-type ligase-like ATP-grasp enzyme
MGRSEVKEVPEEIKELVKKATDVLGVEIAGIDVVVDERDGKAKIIEVNQAPEFGVMERKTGIDIGKKIVEYLLKRMK